MAASRGADNSDAISSFVICVKTDKPFVSIVLSLLLIFFLFKSRLYEGVGAGLRHMAKPCTGDERHADAIMNGDIE